MKLETRNGQRPPAALVYALGRAHPPLSDEQCQVFADLLEEHGGSPHGWPAAQEAFRERYTLKGSRWVERVVL